MVHKSFHLLRTNPALTTNLKIVVSSDYEIYLESIESDRFLNQDRFKSFKLTKDDLLNVAIPKFFKNVPEEIAFSVKYDNDQDIMYKSFDKQIDSLYLSGSRTVKDTRHSEEFEYFAPLHVNTSNMPSNFIVFRLDGPGKTDINAANFNTSVIDNLKVVSLFDMFNSNVGRFMDNNFKNKYFPKSALELDFREFEFSKWNGIDYINGGYSSKSFFLNDTFKNELPFYEFDKVITDGYKVNSIIYPNIINLTFLFDDTPATPESLKKYSINRYLGFYLNSLDLIKTITPFKTYQLVSGGEISNNIFYNSTTSEGYDPIEGGWKEGKNYFVWNNNKFHYLTRTLTGVNTYEYKIISNYVFDTNANALENTDLFNTINTQPNTIVTTYNTIKERTELTLSDGASFISTLPLSEFNKGDVHIIEINKTYNVLKYDSVDNMFYINTDYRIESNTDKIKYWINGEDSEYTVELDLHLNSKQSPPPIFKIYRLNFTDVSDFDNAVKDTKFAGYEYEDLDNSNGIYTTSEGKFYQNDYQENLFEPELITDFPVSSEYIANDEYFAFDKNDNLTQLWRKNPILCKWAFTGSISHNDYPYRINNQISNIDIYNRMPDPKLLDLKRSSNNLDYFYTSGLPTNNYTNHSLHIREEFFDFSKYINEPYDYFSYVFEDENITNDGTTDFYNNTYKYSVFNNGDSLEASSCVFRGSKFKIYDVDNILKDGDNIKELSLKESSKYNNYKLSILYGEKRFDSTNNYTLFTGVEPNIGDSGIDVYVNHKHENVLIHIYVNSDLNLTDTFEKERDLLYNTTNIINANTLNAKYLIFSEFINIMNSINSKGNFDNYLTYWVIEEDGSFDYAQNYNKLAYNSQNIPPFYISIDYPDSFNVNLESLKINSIEGPALETFQNSIYPNKQPLARRFIYDKMDRLTKNIDSRGIFNDTVSINRFRGQYSPIFNIIELFKTHDGISDTPDGNYIFNTNLQNFGICKEQKMSKVNRFENILKLKNERNIPSLYPMIDEFGYFLNDMFIFKSTWDNNYYKEVENNTIIDPTPLNNTKVSYLQNEFKYTPIDGTFNMKEQKSFFGSKGMDIEDIITISEKSITFNENPTSKEQTTLGTGESINLDYNFNTLKNIKHTINQKKLQTDLERSEITKWTLDIDVNTLLEDYLFASIKSARSFIDVSNINTSSNNVDLAIKNYIASNLLDRYEIDRIDFYVQYFSIENDPSLKMYDPLYDLTVKQNKNSNIGNAQLTTDITMTKSIENSNIILEYTQVKNSLDYKFNYYFDIIFKRS